MPTLQLVSRTFPARIADLGFTVPLPSEWIDHPLPDEAPDFDNPASLVALAVVTAPHAVIVVSVAARPAYAEGTLSDWGRWLLAREEARMRTMGAAQLGNLPAFVAEATKDSDLGVLVLRTAFAEDGGRLISVSLTAPEMLADAVWPVWQAVLESFALTSPRGTSVPVYAAPTSAAVSCEADAAGSEESPTAAAAPREAKQRDSKRARKARRRAQAAGGPSWWHDAAALEAAGSVEDAVELVARTCDAAGGLIAQAELWARSMHRCLEAGDTNGARRAWRESVRMADAYAASATSGGEGAALSQERDDFLARLGPEPALS